MNVILASASPRRLELLKQVGIDCTVRVSDVNESIDERDPRELVKKLAAAKAESAANAENAVIIGADTIVYIDGEILGKPTDAQDAFNMLKRLSGRAHEVYTGLAIIDTATGERRVTVDRTAVYITRLTDTQINAYVASGEPMGKAGGYAIQERAALFIERVEGDFFTVVGLPLYRVYEFLQSRCFKQ